VIKAAMAAAPAKATDDAFEPGQKVKILAPPAMAGKLGSVEGPTTKKAVAWKVKLESGMVFEFATENLQDTKAAFEQLVSTPPVAPAQAAAPAAAPAKAGADDDLAFQEGEQVRILAPPAMAGKQGSVAGPTTKKADVWKVKLESGNVFEFHTANLQALAPAFA
jgi:hypothetical protein